MPLWLWITASLISGFSWGFLLCFYWFVQPMARMLKADSGPYDPDKSLTSIR